MGKRKRCVLRYRVKWFCCDFVRFDLAADGNMNQSRFSHWLVGGVALVLVLLAWLAGHGDLATPHKSLTDVRSGTAAISPMRRPSHLPLPPAYESTYEPLPSHLRELSSKHKDRLWRLLRRKLNSTDAIRQEALLKFRSPEAFRDFLSRSDQSGLKILGRLDGLRAIRVGFDDLDKLGVTIESDAGAYEAVDANFIVRVPDPPDPELRSSVSGAAPFGGDVFLQAIGADGDRSTWGSGITVAVLDTGIENHPTFGEGQITHLDLVNDGQPFDGHGTAMASLIGGRDKEAPGVAPASHILDVRIADSQGVSSSFKLAEGIVRAVDAGAQVINISLGSYGDALIVRDAVAYAESQGAVVVGSAGNDRTGNQLTYPAAISSVISVGGVDANYEQAYFSNSGKGLDVTAPAVGIQSAYGAHSIVLGDGASQAAAIASGVLAQGLSSGSTTAKAAADWVKQNALPLSLPPERGGAGMIQVESP